MMLNYLRTNEAIAQSKSLREVLDKLQLKVHGGNYRMIKNFIQVNEISTAHFKDSRGGQKLPIDYYYKHANKFSNQRLIKILVREKILEYKCHKCANSYKLKLKRLPHNKFKLLCPNCWKTQDDTDNITDIIF